MRRALVFLLLALVAGCDGGEKRRAAPPPDRAECLPLAEVLDAELGCRVECRALSYVITNERLVWGSPELTMHRRTQRLFAALRRACGDPPGVF